MLPVALAHLDLESPADIETDSDADDVSVGIDSLREEHALAGGLTIDCLLRLSR
jgi:hypothetical protein